MNAWDELQQWLIMSVGSKQAEQCLAIVERVIVERAEQHASKTIRELWNSKP